MIRSYLVLLIGSLLVGGLQASHAADTSGVHPYLSDTFFVDLGAFWLDRRLKLNVNGSAGEVHDPIEYEEDVRLKKADRVFSLEFGWRFGEKWRLVGQHFESSGDTSWVLEEDIEWEDVVFLTGTNASGGADFTLLRVFFARDFDVGRQHEFGLGAGIHWLEFGAYLEGMILVDDGGTAYAKESVSVSGPLPNIGVWYNYSIANRWVFTSRLDFFSADIGRYDGTMINLSLGVNFQVARHFGLGLNYNHFDLAVKVDNTDWRGRVETNYEGLYANLSFYW